MLFAFGLIVAATTGAASAGDTGATAVVTQFYDWYLAQHGNVDWHPAQRGHLDYDRAMHERTAKYYQAKRFLHPDLFGALDDTYVLAIGDKTPVFYVSTTPAHDADKMSGFDPYDGAASPAASYRVGSPWAGQVAIGGEGRQYFRPVTFVPVTFTFAGSRSTTRITAVVRKNGSSYQIYDFHYGPNSFYYNGRIDDLLRFLSGYNC